MNHPATHPSHSSQTAFKKAVWLSLLAGLGLALFTAPSLQGQANLDRIKQKAKEVKKQAEGQPTNRVTGPKTNAPAKKPAQNAPVK